jgi:putative intracellular protease/amidase
MRDAEVLNWLRNQWARARYILSVCTGALTLGVAGLLRGRRATTHWNSFHLLPYFGATPEGTRFVIDGNLVSTAGVSAGIGLIELHHTLWLRIRSALSNTAFTALNMAAFISMPSARTATAVAVNAGVFLSRRQAKRMSCQTARCYSTPTRRDYLPRSGSRFRIVGGQA